MKSFHWVFFLYSVFAVLSMVGIGISISLKNIYLIISFTIILFVIMGLGFSKKKKMREAGKL